MASPDYLKLLDDMRDLHNRKNSGYAGQSNDPWINFRECELFGITSADGVITRMGDKWSRLRSLWRNPANDQVNEPITDTLMDLAAYALILVCLLQEKDTTT